MECDLSLSVLSVGHTPLPLGPPPRQQGCPTPHIRPGPHLIAAGAAGPQALAVVAATPGRAVLPEVDEVHQRLGALGAHEAGGVPLLAVAGPVRVDHGAVGRRHALAELTDLERWGGGPRRYKVVRRAKGHRVQLQLQSLSFLGDLRQVPVVPQ